MANIGFDRHTGKLLKGWDLVKQSIEDIVTTLQLTRLMVRDYGSEAPKLIDANMHERSLLSLYVTIATALKRWEPRFELTELGFSEVSADGRVVLRLFGDYFERGQYGDKSRSVSKAWEMNL